VRRGHQLYGLGGETVDCLRVRRDGVDHGAGTVGQGAELGDRGAVPAVVGLRLTGDDPQEA
jgi:hypothetical protein